MAFNNSAITIGTTKSDLNEKSTLLDRIYTTVKEQYEPVRTNITGTIPSWLSGDLVRTGPGMFEINGHKFNHLFDGMSILHKFSIHDGHVTYQSKYLRSDTFEKNMTKQRIAVSEFGTWKSPDPRDSLYQRFFASFQRSEIGDNCNVNILPFENDEMYVATETPLLRRFDLKTLNTEEKVDISKIVAVNLATAHPHFDDNGIVYNIGSSYKGGPKYHVIKILPSENMDKEGEQRRVFDSASILSTVQGQFKVCPCYFHSFAMTKNFIVLMEQPYYINVFQFMLKQLFRKPAVESFEFSDKYLTKIHIIRKDSGEIFERQYTSPAQVVFHHINAYEENDQIVMDVVDVKENPLIDAMLDNLHKEDYSKMSGQPIRFVLPLTVPDDANTGDDLVRFESSATAVLQEDGSIRCTGEPLCPPGFELPTINYKQYNGKKYRYFYASSVLLGGKYANSVIKCDTNTKQVQVWKGSSSSFISEPIFVPSPNATGEDDGLVLCGVSDASSKQPDYLVVLDGKSFKEIARAAIPNGSRIPYGFHGQFL